MSLLLEVSPQSINDDIGDRIAILETLLLDCKPQLVIDSDIAKGSRGHLLHDLVIELFNFIGNFVFIISSNIFNKVVIISLLTNREISKVSDRISNISVIESSRTSHNWEISLVVCSSAHDGGTTSASHFDIRFYSSQCEDCCDMLHVESVSSIHLFDSIRSKAIREKAHQAPINNRSVDIILEFSICNRLFNNIFNDFKFAVKVDQKFSFLNRLLFGQKYFLSHFLSPDSQPQFEAVGTDYSSVDTGATTPEKEEMGVSL